MPLVLSVGKDWVEVVNVEGKIFGNFDWQWCCDEMGKEERIE